MQFDQLKRLPYKRSSSSSALDQVRLPALRVRPSSLEMSDRDFDRQATLGGLVSAVR
jgi:hypothetical protein